MSSAMPDQPGVDIESVRRAKALPKVLLHEHLDGGLRAATLHALLRQRGLVSPAADAATLEAWFRGRAHAGSLPEYLAGFALTVAAMGSAAALQRVAFEAAEDALADGVVLAEFRIAPLLFEAHGVAADAAIEAMLAGLASSSLECGLILCAMRERGAAESERVARLAVAYSSQGVIGFDLAGPEWGHPPGEHAAAFAVARDAGLAITCHAGEADGPERVIEALALGARRIGHGVRLADALNRADGAAMLQAVRERNAHLELCPTSNLHTGAVAALAAHPIASLWRAGISLSFHTDNRLMSMVQASDEAANLLRGGALTLADLAAMGVQAARHSFMPQASRAAAEARIRAWAEAQRLTLAPR